MLKSYSAFDDLFLMTSSFFKRTKERFEEPLKVHFLLSLPSNVKVSFNFRSNLKILGLLNISSYYNFPIWTKV